MFRLQSIWFVVCLCLFKSLVGEEWVHLELGAGNYGRDGHTQTSQAKTVVLKLKEITSEPNYIDELEETGSGDYLPEEQYEILFWTLDQMIQRYGEKGIFHVNDLYEDYAEYATEKLANYAASMGYHSVTIESIPGDYASLDPSRTLAKHGKHSYTSIHLKNPEVSFYYDKMDGDRMYSSVESREEARALLQQLANLADDGLYLFILYHPSFVPLEEHQDFFSRGVFYNQTHKWSPVPYVFPEGDRFANTGQVFFISKSQ